MLVLGKARQIEPAGRLVLPCEHPVQVPFRAGQRRAVAKGIAIFGEPAAEVRGIACSDIEIEMAAIGAIRILHRYQPRRAAGSGGSGPAVAGTARPMGEAMQNLGAVEGRWSGTVLQHLASGKGSIGQLQAEQKVDGARGTIAPLRLAPMVRQLQQRGDDIARGFGIAGRPSARQLVPPGKATITLAVLRGGEPAGGSAQRRIVQCSGLVDRTSAAHLMQQIGAMPGHPGPAIQSVTGSGLHRGKHGPVHNACDLKPG